MTPSDQHASCDPAPTLSQDPATTLSQDTITVSHDPAAISHDLTKAEEQAATAATQYHYTYKGDSNVICIQLFCMDEAYEMR